MTYIQLGKFGDIMNILPILHSEHKAGKPPSLMVAEKYASILDGVSYVNPIVFKGGAHEIGKAVHQAEVSKTPFVVSQVVGPTDEVKKFVRFNPPQNEWAKPGSWQEESFWAAGHKDSWAKQSPLVFDRRSPEREAALIDQHCQPRRKSILVASGGETCPFPYKPLLMELIRSKFKSRFQIIDMDEVRGERIYDLLGMFDRARCLVSSDSSLLHLAQASKVPVMALINDKPGLWNGSAWRGRHLFYCRYSNFASRALELLDAIEAIRDPGCPFRADRSKRCFIHTWSQYEVNDTNRKRHEAAQVTWKSAYYAGNWISNKVELGALGRDSRVSPLKDTTRFPFVKDVIGSAMKRAKADDVIVVTPADVSFDESIRRIDKLPTWSYRVEKNADGETHSPRVDFLAFTAAYWHKHRSSYPDMVMGPDTNWSNTLKELIRATGGREVDGVTFWEGSV